MRMLGQGMNVPSLGVPDELHVQFLRSPQSFTFSRSGDQYGREESDSDGSMIVGE